LVFSARKPYLNLKKSVTEFFSSPARFLKPSGQKESQFEKPYLDSEYQAMHLDLPIPDWPTWKFDEGKSPLIRERNKREFNPKKYLSTYAVTDLNKGGICPGCALYIDPVFGKCENPVEVHAGIFCTFDPPKGSDCSLKILSESSSQTVTTGAYWSMGPSKAVWLDPNVAEHIIIAEMIDGAGNTCHSIMQETCGDTCPPTIEFAFDDDSTPDTIVAGSHIDVYVTGGTGPFTYVVSGTGYTWNANGSTTLESSNRNEQLDCAAGT